MFGEAPYRQRNHIIREAEAALAQGERDFQAREALIKQWNIQQKARIEAEYARKKAELQESFRAKRESATPQALPVGATNGASSWTQHDTQAGPAVGTNGESSWNQHEIPHHDQGYPQVQTPLWRARYALHNWRLYLRALACVCAAISVIVQCVEATQCAQAVAGYSSYVSYGNYSASGCWLGYSILLLPIVGAAVLWNIVEFITLYANKKGIHPGAHIALDFLLFATLVGGATLVVIVSVPNYSPTSSYFLLADPLALAAGGCATVAGVLHFVLFIMACIAVHRWRMARKL